MPNRRWFNTPFLSIPALLPPLLLMAQGPSGPLGGPGLDSITLDDLKNGGQIEGVAQGFLPDDPDQSPKFDPTEPEPIPEYHFD